MTARQWPEVKLGDYTELLSGFAFKSKNFTDGPDDIPLVKGANVHQGFIDWKGAVRWPKEQFGDYKKFQLKEHDVVLAMDRPWIEAGLKYAWIKRDDPKSLLVQRVSRLRGLNGLDTRFLRYIIGSPQFTGYIKPIVTGVNVPHISGSQIKDYKFTLPDAEHQVHVVDILEAYDNLIENNKRRIAILEEIAQSLYREWFVKFHYPGYESTKFIDSPLGKIPEGWEIKKLSDVLCVYRGRSYKSIELVDEGGYAFLNLKNVAREGGFRRDGLKRYSGPFKPHQVAKPNDIIMAVTDMTQERAIIARPARVPSMGIDEFVISMDLVKIAVKEGFEESFLYSLLRYSDFPHVVKQFANGANVLHLSPKVIEEYEALIPYESLRSLFSEVVKPIHQIQDKIEKKNDNLKSQRYMLLPKLISGDIEITNTDEVDA